MRIAPMFCLLFFAAPALAEAADYRYLANGMWTDQGPVKADAASLAPGDIAVLWHPDCAPCLKELSALPAMAATFPARRFLLIGFDTPEKLTPKLPATLPANVEAVSTSGEMNRLLESYGDRSHILPYSMAAGRNGAACARHYGPLGEETVKEWSAKC